MGQHLVEVGITRNFLAASSQPRKLPLPHVRVLLTAFFSAHLDFVIDGRFELQGCQLTLENTNILTRS